MRCEHCSNHQMRHTPREPSANPLPSLYKVPTYSTRAGTAPRAPGGARHGGGNRAVTSQPRTGQSTSYGDVKPSYGGQAGGIGGGAQQGHPGAPTDRGRSNTDTQNAGATPGGTRASTANKEEGHSKAGEATRTAGTGNQNGADGRACAWEAATIKPRRYRVPGQPLLNRHQVGGVSRSPDGLFAQQERKPIRGRPAVRGKRTYDGRLGQRVEEQGTWASHTQKHSEAGYERPVDRGAWIAKTVKRPRQQPAHPQYANYWAPLTRKRHTMPHSVQPQHTNYWAPRTRKRHQQEHRPQRPTENSDPSQHAKGRTGDCPGPRKGATTRRNVTQGGALKTPALTPPQRHFHTATPVPIAFPTASYRPLTTFTVPCDRSAALELPP